VPRPVIALARFSARHRRLVLVVWLLVAVGLLAGSRALGSALNDNISVPGSDSAVANDLLARVSSPTATTDGTSTSAVLVAANDAITGHAAQVADFATALGHVRGIVQVTDPLAAGPAAAAAAVTPDGQAVTLRVQSRGTVDDAALRQALSQARAGGLQVGVGNPLLRDAAGPVNSRPSEVIGIVTALVILLVALGSGAATGVPLATALVGVVSGLSLLQLLAHTVSIPTVVPTLATMIGLGVGIDYALFQVARQREALRSTSDRVEAAAVTAATSGAAVAFAGLTVAVAISALAITGVDFISWLGFGTAIVVVVVLLGALTFTPALLAAAGPRIARRGERARKRARAGLGRVASDERAGGAVADERASATAAEPARGAAGDDLADDERGGGVVAGGVADDPEARLDRTRWAAFARTVTRRPWVSVVGSLLVLGVLAVPAASMTLGQGSDGDRPPGTEQRIGYDLVTQHEGAGANAALQVAVALDPAATGKSDPRVAQVAAAVKAVPGVAQVGAPQLAADGTVASLRVTPTTGPADTATADVVAAVRAVAVPQGVQLHVGGATAVRIDLADRVAQRLPWLIGATVAIAALLLVAAFRSVAIALKAALMDLVSVAAAYGVVTAVFEWGWGAHALGLSGPVSIDAYVPMLLFAVLFGLSMDYEVFLLSSIREHWHAGMDTTVAVRRGVASTGWVITAAATIMLAVFASFIRVEDPVIKMFGVGLAVAVLVDATLVRCVLGPAAMVLMGRWNWWLPRWLDRILPRVSL